MNWILKFLLLTIWNINFGEIGIFPLIKGDNNIAEMENNSIMPMNSIEQNYKTVFGIQLASPDSDAWNNNAMLVEMLKSVAVQCPLKGGKAIFDARAMLSDSVLQTLIYDSCGYKLTLPDTSAPQFRKTKHEPNFSNANTIKLYPNPAKDKVTISSNLKDGQNLHIDVYSLAGIKIDSFNFVKIEDDIFEVDIRNWVGGIYLFKFIVDNKLLETTKLVVIK